MSIFINTLLLKEFTALVQMSINPCNLEIKSLPNGARIENMVLSGK